VPSFFLTNSIEAPQGELNRCIMPVLVFFSRNSCKVFNSKVDREYIGPRSGVFSPSICMARSYSQCSERDLAFCILNIFPYSLYSSGSPGISRVALLIPTV